MQGEYYLEVDECSLYAWRKSNEGDYTHLRKGKGKYTNESDIEAFDLLYKDFIKKIGFNESFQNYLDLLDKKIALTFKYLESQKNGIRDRFILNKIKEVDAKLQKHEEHSTEKTTINGILMQLSRMQGYQLKEKDLTVTDYYELIREYNGRAKD